MPDPAPPLPPSASIADLGATRRREALAAVEIWNVRLNLLRTIGSYGELLQHIASPAELAGNNCECNNGCNVPCGSNCGMLGSFDPGALVSNPGMARHG